MRIIALLALCLLPALPAQANWRVTDDGSAIIETDGSSALSLRCDNNANTGNKPGWLLKVDALSLRQQSSRMEMVFRFPGHAPLRLMGDNRNGSVQIDSMTQATQGDLQTLLRRLKSASRVTVTLINDASGAAMEPLVFGLRGSSRAIGQVAKACQ
jgi:hypothetical protein